MVDLHTHSRYSDGTYTPAELIECARHIGLQSIALCDHNTLDGLPEFKDAAAKNSIEAVPGIEISAEYNGRELHIVGLFVSESYYGKINTMLDFIKQQKIKSNIDLIARLNDIGFSISYSEIEKQSAGFINRANIAATLTEKGYTASVAEAFDKYLSLDKGLYVPPERLSVYDVIKMLASVNAVPVLAHPFLNLSAAELSSFLPDAKTCGLLAMEVEYSLFNNETKVLARKIADEFNLAYSGGSDFHGANKPDIKLGTGKGDLFVCDEYYYKLRAFIH